MKANYRIELCILQDVLTVRCFLFTSFIVRCYKIMFYACNPSSIMISLHLSFIVINTFTKLSVYLIGICNRLYSHLFAKKVKVSLTFNVAYNTYRFIIIIINIETFFIILIY